MDTKSNQRVLRSGRVRRALARLEQHLRVQREVLWDPRLGLVGTRRPVRVAAAAGRRFRS